MTALFGAHNASSTHRAAFSDSFAHRAPQGAGEEGKARGASGYCLPAGLPSATRPATSGLPLGSTAGLKRPRASPPARALPAPRRAGLGACRDPAPLPARPAPRSPRGHLPSSRKTRGRSARRSRSQERAGAMAAASLRRERGLPAGRAAGTCDGLVDPGKALGSK